MKTIAGVCKLNKICNSRKVDIKKGNRLYDMFIFFSFLQVTSSAKLHIDQSLKYSTDYRWQSETHPNTQPASKS